MFIVDIDDKDKVIQRGWHYRSEGKYMASSYEHETGKKELYLHNFVMNKLTFEGKGQQHTIDHINRIGTDNRKLNLRMATSQSAQNFNQKRRERKIELPEGCDILVSQIPKNVYYGKPNGLHGEFFYIEINGINDLSDGKFNWKSTKSKSVNLKNKLELTIQKLSELKSEHPVLNDVIIDIETEKIRENLIKEYNEIIKLSHYPKNVINDNLVKFESDIIVVNNENENENENNLDKIKIIKDLGKKVDKLPVDCGITIDMIPKYCYFKPESDKRGCKFIIERHPKLVEQGSRQWATPESKKISINDKYNLMIEKLNELN